MVLDLISEARETADDSASQSKPSPYATFDEYFRDAWVSCARAELSAAHNRPGGCLSTLADEANSPSDPGHHRPCGSGHRIYGMASLSGPTLADFVKRPAPD